MTTTSDDAGPQCPSCGDTMAFVQQNHGPGWACTNHKCTNYNPAATINSPEESSSTLDDNENLDTPSPSDGPSLDDDGNVLPPNEQDDKPQTTTDTGHTTAEDLERLNARMDADPDISDEPHPDLIADDTVEGSDDDNSGTDAGNDKELQCARCDELLDHHQPECPYCGFTAPSFAKTTAMFLIGAVLTFTIIGAILGIPLMISATGALAAKGGDHPNSIAAPADD